MYKLNTILCPHEASYFYKKKTGFQTWPRFHVVLGGTQCNQQTIIATSTIIVNERTNINDIS